MQGDFKTQTHDLSRYKNMEKQLNKVLNTETLKQATKTDYVTKLNTQNTEGKQVTITYYIIVHRGKLSTITYFVDKVDET